MAQNTLVDFADGMKDVFASEAVKDQLHNRTNAFKWFKEKKIRGRGGRGVASAAESGYIFSVETRRPAGVGWAADAADTSAALPAAERPRVDKAAVHPKWLYGRVEASGQLIRLSQDNENAFAREITYSMKRMITAMSKMLNYSCFGSGAGELARLNENPDGAATAIDVDAANHIYNGTGTASRHDTGTRYVWPGMVLQAGSALFTPTIRAGTGQVSSVAADDATGTSATVTFDSAPDAAWADNDYLFLNGTAVAGSTNSDTSRVMNGLLGLVGNDGALGTSDLSDTVHNINASTAGNEFWRPYIRDNSGTSRALTLGLMHLVYDRVSERGNGETPNKIVMHKNQRRRYTDLLSPDVRYSPQELLGGFSKLTFAGGDTAIPIETDDDCPYGVIFFLNTDSFRLGMWHDLGWANEDGLLLRNVSGEDSWEAFAVTALELYCDRRNANGILTDLNVSLTS